MEQLYPVDPEAFLALFGGRRDCYILHDGESFRAVKAALDVDGVKAHFDGTKRVGIYCNQGANGELSGFGCIDLDIDDQEIAASIASIASNAGLVLSIERSRSKGWHCWFFLEKPILAMKVRRVLRAIVADAVRICGTYLREKHSDVDPNRKIEIFPKDDSIASGSYGFGVMLPLHGESVKAGRTTFFRVNDGAGGDPLLPVGDWRLDQVVRLTEQHFDGVIARLPPNEPHHAADAGAHVGDAEPNGRAETITEGTRNRTLFQVARTLCRSVGTTEEESLGLLRVMNHSRCKPPLSDFELAKIAKSATSSRYERVELRVASIEADRPISYLDLEKIAENGVPPIDWLLKGWLMRHDVGIAAGPAYAGKTTLAYLLAIALATGRAWCGITPTTTGRVLIFDEEQGINDTARLLLRLGARGAANLRVASGQGIDLASDDGCARLRREIARERPLLVLLDSARHVFVGVDENDSRQVAPVFARLFRIRDEYGVTFLIVHHTCKQSENRRDPLSMVRGSTAWTASASTIWIVTRVGSVVELVQAKRRGSQVTSLRVSYEQEGEDGAITLHGEGTVEQRETINDRACKAILELVQQKGEARTAEIQEHGKAEGFDQRAITRALTHLVDIGALRRPKQGRYVSGTADEGEERFEA